jgi:outer membrane scaffolding protein for murein synthesis (MipA/OmpV family)
VPAYFGVNADNVGTSGLPSFKADSGENECHLSAGTVVYLSREWVPGAGVRYGRITGDAADSPLGDQRGDENQVIGGIGSPTSGVEATLSQLEGSKASLPAGLAAFCPLTR